MSQRNECSKKCKQSFKETRKCDFMFFIHRRIFGVMAYKSLSFAIVGAEI